MTYLDEGLAQMVWEHCTGSEPGDPEDCTSCRMEDMTRVYDHGLPSIFD